MFSLHANVFKKFYKNRGSDGSLFCLSVFFHLLSEVFYHKVTFLLCEFDTAVKLCSGMQSIMEEFIMTDPSLCHSHCRLFVSTLSIFSIFSYTQQYFFWQAKWNLSLTFCFKRPGRMSFDFIFHKNVMSLQFFKNICNSFCVLLFLYHSVILSFCTKTYILWWGLVVYLFFTFFFFSSENVFGKRISYHFQIKKIYHVAQNAAVCVVHCPLNRH